MNLTKIFNRLYKQYGPQGWWPVSSSHCEPQLRAEGEAGGETISYKPRLPCPRRAHDDRQLFEICVGAILTQNTAWKNVEKAIKCLLDANLMTPAAITKCPISKLQRCVHSSGYYKQKAKKLKIFAGWLVKNYRGNLRLFFKKPLVAARTELLRLWGIGPETADSILLYAGGKPIFVIDAYTKRLCRKHGIRFKSYDEYQKFFEKGLSPHYHPGRSAKPIFRLRPGHTLVQNDKTRLYNEFHALIVQWGKMSSSWKRGSSK